MAWAVVFALGARPTVAAEPSPARSLGTLDEEFAASVRDLARRADNAGAAELAALVRDWHFESPPGTLHVPTIPSRLERPACVDTEAEEGIWRDFLGARRSRAEGIYALAVESARAHDRVASREERARPDAEAPPLPQRSCEALRLVYRAVRDDPNHERARAAGGWVRRGEAWVWPGAARRIDRGEEFDPAYGWLPKAKLVRYRAGERSDRNRWITAAEDDARTPDLKHGREFASDHWEIVSAAPLADAAALAARLEETRSCWIQAFGGFLAAPRDLERRIAGRGRSPPQTPHSAVLCRDRGQYLAELEPLEHRIGLTDGIYWQPTKTAWFHVRQPAAEDPRADRLDGVTVHHEATHQLFAETRPEMQRLGQQAGERCGFWAVEAAACYLETMRPAPHGWLVGGRDAGRVPAARDRLLEDGLFVPLEKLTALGRTEFQGHDQVQALYSQVAGLADFFMHGRRGRYREAFVEYLARVYAGTADPDTLARLCRRPYADLDDEYRRHLAE